MMIGPHSAAQIAAAGMQAATTRFAKASQTIAEHGAGAVEPIVEAISAKTDFKANLAVLRASDRMTGALLDIFA